MGSSSMQRIKGFAAGTRSELNTFDKVATPGPEGIADEERVIFRSLESHLRRL